MDHRHALVMAAALLASGTASAFYSSVTPPDGWSAGGGPGGQMSKAISSAQASSKFTSTVTKIPVGMRFASGAARLAARAILGGGVVGAGVIAATWLAENCFEKHNGQWVRTCGSGTGEVSTGLEWSFPSLPVFVQRYGWKSTPDAACELLYLYYRDSNAQAAYSNMSNGSCFVRRQDGAALYQNTPGSRQSACPAGWYRTPDGQCTQTPQPIVVTPQEVEDAMAPKTVPPGLPGDIPGTPLPIEIPTINPNPSSPTIPMPWKQPTGDPILIPDTNPQRYKQPWVTVSPSPTTGDPWRVDVKPESTETTSPNPVGPDGIAAPQTNNQEKKPETPDLCEKNPDILACQKLKLGTLDPQPVPNENKPLAINADSGWGPSTASCPANRTANLSFGPLQFSYDPLCQFAQGIRPVVIALAWCLAAFAFFGMGRKGD